MWTLRPESRRNFQLVTRARIARLAGGYSALAQLSSGEVLCMWEGPCTDKGANSLSEFCLASIQV